MTAKKQKPILLTGVEPAQYPEAAKEMARKAGIKLEEQVLRPRPAVGTRGHLSGRPLVMTKDGWRFEDQGNVRYDRDGRKMPTDL